MAHYNFKYPYASYMDVSLMRETHSKKELLKEYKKLRAEANRRLARLEKYEWMKDTDAYQYNKDMFKGGVSRMTKADLAKQMRDAAIFLSSHSSTIKGQIQQRRRLRDTLHIEWGMDFITKNNVIDFARYLGAVREKYGSGSYTMTEIEARFRAALKEGLDMNLIKSNFEEFQKKAEESASYEHFLEVAQEHGGSSLDYARYKIRY